MQKAYSYVRFSTPEQSRGDSFRRQLELSRRFAQERGLELDEALTFRDLGVSAFSGKNAEGGALAAFIDAVECGQISAGSYLLVESLDRLSRERVLKAFQLLSGILERGIYVATLQDGKVYSPSSFSDNFTDLMMSLMIMFRANEESETKAKRLRAAWEAKRGAASSSGQKLTAICPAWLELSEDRGRFRVREDRAAVVRRVFALTLDGVGAARIATIFNEEGVATFGRSEGWHPSYLKKMLSNPAVIGVYQPMKTHRDGSRKRRAPDGEEIRDYFPPIIDEEAFLRAQTVRTSRRIGGGKKGVRFSNLFTGLTKCGHCGGPMHFINKGRGEHYLCCSNARRRVGNCSTPSWQYRPVEAFLLLTLAEVDYRELFPAVWETASRRINDLDAALLVKEEELRRTRDQLGNVVTLLSERPDSAALLGRLDTLERDADRLEGEVKTLRANAADERERLSTVRHDHDQALDALERLAAVHRSGDSAEVFQVRSRLHQLLKRTIDDIEFTASPDDPARHGHLAIRFKDAPSIGRRLEVMRGQREGHGYKVEGGEVVPGSGRYVGVGRGEHR